ncbi:hypothetical protein Bbelb_374820 [Branchiostoma belcheri]|nr:hypothetical protein Bbelb_374820 [Branchiostoma belcheri]
MRGRGGYDIIDTSAERTARDVHWGHIEHDRTQFGFYDMWELFSPDFTTVVMQKSKKNEEIIRGPTRGRNLKKISDYFILYEKNENTSDGRQKANKLCSGGVGEGHGKRDLWRLMVGELSAKRRLWVLLMSCDRDIIHGSPGGAGITVLCRELKSVITWSSSHDPDLSQGDPGCQAFLTGNGWWDIRAITGPRGKIVTPEWAWRPGQRETVVCSITRHKVEVTDRRSPHLKTEPSVRYESHARYNVGTLTGGPALHAQDLNARRYSDPSTVLRPGYRKAGTKVIQYWLPSSEVIQYWKAECRCT